MVVIANKIDVVKIVVRKLSKLNNNKEYLSNRNFNKWIGAAKAGVNPGQVLNILGQPWPQPNQTFSWFCLQL